MYVIVFLLPKSCSLERVAYWFCETEKLTFILGYYSYATGAHAKQKNSFFLQQQPKAFVGGNQFSCRLSKAGFSFCIFLFAWEKSRARRFGGVCVCKNSSQVALFSAHFFLGSTFLSRHDLWVFHSNPFRLLIIESIDTVCDAKVTHRWPQRPTETRN